MTSTRDPYVTAAVLGLVLLLSGSATYSIAVLMAKPEDIATELIIWVPTIIAGLALWFWRRWGLLLAAIVGALGSIALFSETDLALIPPDSLFDFVPTILALTGILIVFLASAAGTVQYFRGSVGTSAAGVLAGFKGLVAVLAVLAAISAVLTALGAGGVSSAEAKGSTVLTADGVKWDMQTIDASPRQTIRILVKNKDPFVHTFTIHDLDIDEVVGPWTEKIVEIELPEARIYGFICRIENHKQDMSGVFVVR